MLGAGAGDHARKKNTRKHFPAGVRRLIGCNGPQQEVCVIYGLLDFHY